MKNSRCTSNSFVEVKQERTNFSPFPTIVTHVQKESRLRELIRYMFYSVQTESDSVQSADKLSALNI